MNRWLIIAVLGMAVLFMFGTASAEKETFFGGTIFAHGFTDLSDTTADGTVPSSGGFDSYSSFRISRAYLTGKAKLSDKTYGKITFDIDPGSNDIRMQYAYMMWKFYTQENFSFSTQFGLHPNPWLAGMHKVVREYVGQTRSQHWGSNNNFWTGDGVANRLADYGVSFIGSFGEKGKFGHAYLSVLNGTGADDPMDGNPKKDVNFVVWVNPFTSEDLVKSKVGVQYYKGWEENYTAQDDDNEDMYKYNLLSAMGNIQYKGLFNLGTEFNSYTHNMPEGTDDAKASAMTLFGTLWFAELFTDQPAMQTLNVFFRYGMVDLDTDTDDDEINNILVGVECNPVKGFATSLNYRSETFKMGEGNDDYIEKFLSLNAVFDF